MNRVVCSLLLTLSVGCSVSLANDWPSWRGPEQNGSSRETGLPATWSPNGENLVWHAPFGNRSGLVVMNGSVYMIRRTGEGIHEQEEIAALDAATGKVVWEHKMPLFLTDVPAPRVGWANVCGDPETGNIYAQGVQGLLVCLDGKTGKEIWWRSLTEEFGRVSGYGGRTTTPIIDEDKCIIAFISASWGAHGKGSQRYYAFDKRTGEIRWIAEPSGQPLDTFYCVPVVAVVNGVRMIFDGNADGHVYGLKARTGEKVWSFPLSKRGINASVVVNGNKVYGAHSDENVDSNVQGRITCLDGATGKELWRAEGFVDGYSTPAFANGKLYAVDNAANLACFDGETGKELWRIKIGTVGKGSPVVADGKVYVADVQGTFSIVDISGERPKMLNQQHFLDAKGAEIELNGSPAVANGRVYLTTREEIYCIAQADAKPQQVAVPPVAAEAPVDASAKPAFLQVEPAETVLSIGGKMKFRCLAYNDRGQLIGPAQGVQWGLAGSLTNAPPLKGTIADGGFASPPDVRQQAGQITAKAGGLTGAARVRVIPPMPLNINFDPIPAEKPPSTWINCGGKFMVIDDNGNKMLKKLATNPSPLVAKASTFFGLPSWGNYTIGCDLMGTEAKRNLPDMGIINSRYMLVLVGNHQKLRLLSWDHQPEPRLDKTMPFKWDPKVWYRAVLRVEPHGETATLKAKIWPKADKEPAAWTIEVEDPCSNGCGSPGLYAYAWGITEKSPGTEVFYDNLTVTENK